MTAVEPISQRDLRLRSAEIMDAVESGTTFAVTRSGRTIGELIPIADRRPTVSRERFLAWVQRAPRIDAAEFRADLDAAIDPGLAGPYAR